MINKRHITIKGYYIFHTIINKLRHICILNNKTDWAAPLVNNKQFILISR